MKKYCFLSLMLLMLCAMGLHASQKNEYRAAIFLGKSRMPMLKMWDSNVLIESTGKKNITYSEPAFEVYASADKEGFVILSGNAVIGYSETGTIAEIDNIPDAMRDYLLELAYNGNSSATRTDGNIGEVIVQIETANWAQHDPYNRLCPIKGGRRCLTGCIPTAFAIVMRHHKWPEYGNGKVYNPITGEAVDISNHRYDWDNMPLTYKSGEYSDAQANEVSALMQHLGYAYMVEYGTGSTGGSHNSEKLAKYFGYENVGKTQRWQVGDAEWERLIKESLDSGCPVPYAATNAGSGDARHIFVLDGYTDNGYYHFNWGWGGSGNGYFLLSSMKPSNSDDYSSKADSHQAYFNLRPAKPTIQEYTVTVSATEGGSATISGETSVTVAEGTELILKALPDSGYVFSYWTMNGTQVGENAEMTITVSASVEYIAHFAPIEVIADVTVELNSAGNGSVYINEPGVTSMSVEKGTTVNIFAVPDDGYEFHYWAVEDGGLEYPLDSAGANHTIALEKDIVLYAYFKPLTAIDECKEKDWCSVTIDGKLHITGVCGNIRVIDCNGTLYGMFAIEGESIVELPAGCYIVEYEKKSVKILIKNNR